jgi:hypothetical protein
MRLSPAGVFFTRWVSQIVEYHLVGLAQLLITILGFRGRCNTLIEMLDDPQHRFVQRY